MEEEEKEIYTVKDLIEKLKKYDENLQIDMRYDSGHGHGWICLSSFSVKDNVLRIDVS